MPDRALIIAVEDYPDVVDGFTAKKLKDTLKAAGDFLTWLEGKWKAEGTKGTIYFCSTEKRQDNVETAPAPVVNPLVELKKFGADRASIVKALAQLEKDGRDKTDNLYVYFSGHGFRLKNETLKLADALVASDFQSIKLSADCCFKLDALVEGLRTSLGRGCHFYFIDACRNEVPKAIGSGVMPFDGLGAEEPSVFVLQSTVAGAPSLVGGLFATSLLQGLQGTGRAKAWTPPVNDSMRVHFDSLRRFLKSIVHKTQPITHTVSGELGETEAMLATIRPVLPKKLTVNVQTTMTTVAGTLEITTFNGANLSPRAVNAAQTVIELPPDDYKVRLVLNNAITSPSDFVDVGLYEDAEVSFAATTSRVQLEGLEGMRGARPVGDRPFGFAGPSKRGTGGLISKGLAQTGVKGGTPLPRQVAQPLPLASESIKALLPQAGEGLNASEALHGNVQDPDLAIWLAILGGGRILGSTGDYSKIGALPLQDFQSEPPDASPVYVLAGFNTDKTRLLVGHGPKATPTRWKKAASPPGMPGVFEVVLHPLPGQTYLTLAIDDQPAYTLTSCAMPNRCTLVVLTLGEEGQPHVSQYLLPIGHLVHRLDDTVQSLLQYRNQLKDVQVLALLARAFRKRRKLVNALDATIEDNLRDVNAANEIQSLLHSKWLDPIGASMAMYESVRRRNTDDLQIVASNMIRYFHDFPDTRAIATMAGVPNAAPTDVIPLFLQGLQALPPDKVELPFPNDLLDFSGPWTAWRGAVKVPV